MQEFLCQEHVDIPDEETLEDLNGVKRKTMHDSRLSYLHTALNFTCPLFANLLHTKTLVYICSICITEYHYGKEVC